MNMRLQSTNFDFQSDFLTLSRTHTAVFISLFLSQILTTVRGGDLNLLNSQDHVKIHQDPSKAFKNP